MTDVIVDAALLEKLTAPGQTLRVCDEFGHAVGYFQPIAVNGNMESPFSAEEIRERCRYLDGRPLAEILKDLESQCDSR